MGSLDVSRFYQYREGRCEEVREMESEVTAS